MARVFTVAEVAQLLRDEDGKDKSGKDVVTLTPRAIRYYRRSGMVEPTGGRVRGRKGARLYTLTDIAMLRLAWLLRAKYRVSERGAWAVLVLRGEAIRRQIDGGEGAIEFDEPAPLRSRGTEIPRSERPKRTRVPIRIPITLVLPPSLARRAQDFRADEPDIWTGYGWVPEITAAKQAIA